MHILLLPSSYAPKVGGLETAVAQLGAELVRRGHRVTVLTNRYPRTLPSYERIGDIAVHRILMTNLLPNWGQLKRLPKYVAGVALAPIQLLRLARLIRALEPDIVNVHYLGVPAVYARLASKRRLVISLHGSDLAARPYATGGASLSRYAVAGARAATACSANQAALLPQLIGASSTLPVVVTGNGVDPSEFTDIQAYQHPRPYLFAAARFSPVKGLDVLIRAMPGLIAQGLDVDLILAGGGPQAATLHTLTHELGVEQHVHFWGLANRHEIAALLRGCSLFVLPSRAEAFGIAALEAMICGKAVVASRCGGIPEVVLDGEAGVLVPPDDAAALSAALAGLLHDPARCEQLGRRGRELALGAWSWSSVADRYLQAYRMAQE